MGRSGALYGQLNLANTWNGLNTFFGGIRVNGVRPNVVAKTGAYTAAVTDVVILGNATTAAFTVSLPFATFPSGLWMVKKTDASVNAVTVAGVTGTIDGAASFALAAANNAVLVVSDGTNGWIIGKV